MNDQQSKMMNQSMLNQVAMMNQQQKSQLMVAAQSQAMNMNQQSQLLLGQSQGMSLMNNSSQSMPPPPQMMGGGRGYKPWAQQQKSGGGGFVPKQGRSNWKGRKGGGDMRKDSRRMEKPMPMLVGNVGAGPSGGGGGGGVYKPPSLNDLQSQNRMKAKKFYHQKKKFNNRFAPYAPRNTSSYIIRAKKSGGIASLVSPCPVTPAVLPTPVFSPSREVLGDMAKEEWGVDGYGSMKGLIRLRNDAGDGHDEDDDEEGSSDSDVEEHVEVERRLDHDLSRFEMIYPNYGLDYNNVLENRVDDQDTHIAQLEEENLTLKERLFLMESEVAELRRRMQCLERRNHVVEDVNEEVVENVSENESEGGVSDMHGLGGQGKEDAEEFACGDEEGTDNYVNAKDEGRDDMLLESEGKRDVPMEAVKDESIVKENEVKDEGAMHKDVLDQAGDGKEKDFSRGIIVGKAAEGKDVTDEAGDGDENDFSSGFTVKKDAEWKDHSKDDNDANKIGVQALTSEIDGAKNGAALNEDDSNDNDKRRIAVNQGHVDEEMENISSEKSSGDCD